MVDRMLNTYMQSKEFERFMRKIRKAANIIKDKLKGENMNEADTELSKGTKRNSQYRTRARTVLWITSHAWTTQPEGCWTFESSTDEKPIEKTSPRAANAATCWTFAQVTFLEQHAEDYIRFFYGIYEKFKAHEQDYAMAKNRTGTKDGEYVLEASPTPPVEETDHALITITNKLMLYILTELDTYKMVQYLESLLTSWYTPHSLGKFLEAYSLILYKDTPLKDPLLTMIRHTLIKKEYETVIEILHREAYNSRYRICDMPPEAKEVNKDELNLSTFAANARNTQEVHLYTSPNKLTLVPSSQMVTYDMRQATVLLLTFVQNQQNYIFDVLATPSHSEEEWANLSWYERLALFQLDLKTKTIIMGQNTFYNIVDDIRRISVAHVYFHNFIQTRDPSYLYVRTTGFGTGTLFLHEPKRGKSGGRTRRHKKVNRADLLPCQGTAVPQTERFNQKYRCRPRIFTPQEYALSHVSAPVDLIAPSVCDTASIYHHNILQATANHTATQYAKTTTKREADDAGSTEKPPRKTRRIESGV